MSKRMKKVSMAISVIMLIISFLLYRYRVDYNTAMGVFFTKLADGKQFRSVIVCSILFIYGWFLVNTWKVDCNLYLKALLAFPVALSVWCVSSAFLLIAGISYSLLTASLVMAAALLGSMFINRESLLSIDVRKIKWWESIILFCLFVSVTAFLSTGFPNSYMSFDSYYYILDWGKVLAKLGKFTENQGESLFHTGLMPAIISSLAAFFHINNIYTLHHCLMACFWGLFIYVCYGALEMKKEYVRFPASAVAAGFVYFLPPVRVLSGYIISNAYQMALSFFFIILLWKVMDQERLSAAERTGLFLAVLFFSLLRSDAPITICIIVFCFISCGFRDKWFIVQLLFCSALFLTAYYMRIFYVCTSLEGEFLQKSTIMMILAVYVMVMLYAVIMNYFSDKWLFRYMELISYSLLILLNIGLWYIFREVYKSNFEVIFHNATSPDVLWGKTFWLALLMLFYLFVVKKGPDPLLMVFIFVVVIGADMGVIRTTLGHESARVGFGDSMNRYICSFLPLLMGTGIVRFMNDLKSKFKIIKQI